MHIETNEGHCRLYLVQDRERLELPALWLRERSPDPAQCDPLTHQRLYDPHQLPEDLAVVSARIEGDDLDVAFNDGHAARFSTAALLAALDPSHGLPAPVAWRAEQPPSANFDWQSVSRPGQVREMLSAFLTFGFVILRNTPTERRSVLTIAETFGHVRNTNFGSVFEVYSQPDSNDLAYRPVPLTAHTDNPYREPVPGIQLLQCLVNETSGGLSTLVDGLAATEALRDEDPDGYDLLAGTLVGYRFIDNATEHFALRSMITLGPGGVFDGIYYSPRLDETPLLEPSAMRAFHTARRRLGELLADPRFELRFQLAAGELMMFDNIRVLHGRTGFDPNEGHRQLQGCYIDRDGPRSLYRIACRNT